MTKRLQGGSAVTGLVGTTLGLALLVAGCSGDNSGSPSGYQPEGVQGTAILLSEAYPIDADTTQVFIRMLVVSPPPPDGFRFYVNPNGEGFRAATDVAVPATTTFDTGWGFYQSSLEGYDPTTTSLELMARGARHGIESDAGLVTSTSYIPASSAVNLARREVVQQIAPADEAIISTLAFSWQPLPGAQSYLLQVFNASTGEPGLLVYQNSATGQQVELELGILNQVVYRWGVVAYDAGGRAMGMSAQRQVQYVPAGI